MLVVEGRSRCVEGRPRQVSEEKEKGGAGEWCHCPPALPLPPTPAPPPPPHILVIFTYSHASPTQPPTASLFSPEVIFSS